MKITNEILSLIVIVFLISSCGKKESGKIEVNNKKIINEAHKIIRKNETIKYTQPRNNTTSQVTKKTTAKIEQVRKETDELLNAMEINNKSDENNDQEKIDLLNIDWRNIQNHRERYSWALKVKQFEEGKQMALDALASLTNSSDVTFSTLSYTVLAQNAGRNGDMNKVKGLLEDCEKKLGLNPSKRDEINDNMAKRNVGNLTQIWKMRAALARTLANQKFKGQYDSNIDNHPESYWHKLRLEWSKHYYKEPTNGRAQTYADLAYALMNEGNKKEAIKELEHAINYLSVCEDSAMNKEFLNEYKEVQKQFKSGFNGAPARYYW